MGKEVVIKKVLTDKGWLLITEDNKHLYPQYYPGLEKVETKTETEAKTKPAVEVKKKGK